MNRTNKDIFRQLEELTLNNERMSRENKRLRTENSDLRAENSRLRKRVETLEASIDECVSKAVEEAVTKAVAPLYAAIAEKDKEILRLKSQIDKDSSNSSKPPGSNGYKKILNNREKSEKKQGGQPGHKGFRLNTFKRHCFNCRSERVFLEKRITPFQRLLICV